MDTNFDFVGYVAARKAGPTGVARRGLRLRGRPQGAPRAAQGAPVELAMAQTVKLSKAVLTGDLLGTAVKVGPTQFPRIHRIVERVRGHPRHPPPQVYIVPRNSHQRRHLRHRRRRLHHRARGAVEQFSATTSSEFVIGHECGHIQNNHVVYLTTLSMLQTMRRVGLLAPLLMPAAARAADLVARGGDHLRPRGAALLRRTCDAATDSFSSSPIGSPKLFEELNVEEYLAAARGGARGLRPRQASCRSHPYLTKRIEARSAALQPRARSTASPSGGLVGPRSSSERQARRRARQGSLKETEDTRMTMRTH
jgi:hypothetical protein